MISVNDLIAKLLEFPGDAVCYAYEGEIRGVVISKSGSWGGDLGYIIATEDDADEGKLPANHAETGRGE